MSGDPNLATTSKAIQILDQLGADVIELGVPYSVRPISLLSAAATRPALHNDASMLHDIASNDL